MFDRDLSPTYQLAGRLLSCLHGSLRLSGMGAFRVLCPLLLAACAHTEASLADSADAGLVLNRYICSTDGCSRDTGAIPLRVEFNEAGELRGRD